MHSTLELIREATSLPAEERTRIVDSLLKSLYSPDLEIERKWVEVAQQRLGDLNSGKVKGIPGDVVFDNLMKKYSVSLRSMLQC